MSSHSRAPRPSKAAVVSDFRRGQILEAARETFIRCGLADSSVDRIARAAKVAKGTVYLYYKSKDEILQQLFASDLTELHADTVPAITGPGTLGERLDRYFRATLTFFERKRDFIEQCHLDMSADVRKKAKQKLGLIFAAQVDAWAAVLGEGCAATADSARSDTAKARIIVSLAHGLAIQRLRGWHTGSIEDATAQAAALVLNGVARS